MNGPCPTGAGGGEYKFLVSYWQVSKSNVLALLLTLTTQYKKSVRKSCKVKMIQYQDDADHAN